MMFDALFPDRDNSASLSPKQAKAAEVIDAMYPKGEDGRLFHMQDLAPLQGVYVKINEFGHLGSAESKIALEEARTELTKAEWYIKALGSVQYTLFDRGTIPDEAYTRTLAVHLETFLDADMPDGMSVDIDSLKREVRTMLHDELTGSFSDDQLNRLKEIFAEDASLNQELEAAYMADTAPYRELILGAINSELSASEMQSLRENAHEIQGVLDLLNMEDSVFSDKAGLARALRNILQLIPPAEEAGIEDQREWFTAMLELEQNEKSLQDLINDIDQILAVLETFAPPESAGNDAESLPLDDIFQGLIGLALLLTTRMMWKSTSRRNEGFTNAYHRQDDERPLFWGFRNSVLLFKVNSLIERLRQLSARREDVVAADADDNDHETADTNRLAVDPDETSDAVSEDETRNRKPNVRKIFTNQD